MDLGGPRRLQVARPAPSSGDRGRFNRTASDARPTPSSGNRGRFNRTEDTAEPCERGRHHKAGRDAADEERHQEGHAAGVDGPQTWIARLTPSSGGRGRSAASWHRASPDTEHREKQNSKTHRPGTEMQNIKAHPGTAGSCRRRCTGHATGAARRIDGPTHSGETWRGSTRRQRSVPTCAAREATKCA